MKILLDTNVIIDALTSREPWNFSAEKIFLLTASRCIDMYITASTVTDIYYLVHKHLHNAEETKQVMGKLFSLADILDVTGTDCINVLASPINDYEDAVLESVARNFKVDYIVTRNIQDFQAGTMKSILPDTFITIMEELE